MNAALRIAPLGLVLALAACDSVGPEEMWVPVGATPSAEAFIVLGNETVIDGLAVRFSAVVEDTRCPPCFDPGYATVELVVEDEAFVLPVRGRNAVRVGERAVSVVDLTPYPDPHSEDPIDATPVVEVAVFEVDVYERTPRGGPAF